MTLNKDFLAPIPKENIFAGRATVVAVRDRRTKKIYWAIPGGDYTGDKEYATYVAERIADLIPDPV